MSEVEWRGRTVPVKIDKARIFLLGLADNEAAIAQVRTNDHARMHSETLLTFFFCFVCTCKCLVIYTHVLLSLRAPGPENTLHVQHLFYCVNISDGKIRLVVSLFGEVGIL